MSVLGIIPARKGSLRFPDKHHAVLAGKPMFAYTIEAALAATRIDRLVISSDDPELKPLAAQYGVEFLERPPELATATAALDDALRDVCRTLQVRDGFDATVIVTMQGNVPLREEGMIDRLIVRFDALPGASAICTVGPLRGRPEWAKRIVNTETGEAAPFMTGAMSYRTQDFPPLYVMDGAIYGVRRTTLDETVGQRAAHAWFGSALHLLLQTHPMYSLEVDYPEQLELAEYYMLRKRLGAEWAQWLTAASEAVS